MRAIVLNAPGDLTVAERPVPAPGPGEVQVRMRRGGICGSDLHYYHQGGFGVVRMSQPMVLGHELAGEISALGAGVTAPTIGTLVAVNPSSPCGVCSFCRMGQRVHCSDMRFLGSAMRTPHVQGGFTEYLVCDAGNAVALPPGIGADKAAFAEPLAVCLHAVGEAPVYGARVLITGAGPIGVLLVLAARFAGAREIVVTDILDRPLQFARAAGADRVINVATDAAALEAYSAGKGTFDVAFEAAGQSRTVQMALQVTRPRGTIVLVGQGATAELPVSLIVTKEIALRGSFRFDREFALAVELIGSGRIDVSPLLSAVLPLDQAVAAFDLASDKGRSMKVQIDFA
jgi:L-idonate 5-dehydrogenase